MEHLGLGYHQTTKLTRTLNKHAMNTPLKSSKHAMPYNSVACQGGMGVLRHAILLIHINFHLFIWWGAVLTHMPPPLIMLGVVTTSVAFSFLLGGGGSWLNCDTLQKDS